MKEGTDTTESIVNNVNLKLIERTKDRSNLGGGHFPVEKTLQGEFRFDGSPMFTGELKSESASFIVGVDEPSVLGGRGVYTTPLSYLLFGVVSCFANTLAIRCAIENIKLKRLRLTGKLTYDIGPVLTAYDFPLINKLEIEVEADTDIRAIVEASRPKCPALYAITHSIESTVKTTVAN